MATLSLLGQIFWPTGGGLWEKILHGFYNGIGSYVWAIIIFTIVLKLIMTPLDFLQRRVTAKNAKTQALMKPELEKLEKQCKGNKQLFNQKQMELNKKFNNNVMGSCVIMLLNLGLTMAIFFTLFGSLRNIADINTYDQYQAIRYVYYESMYVERADYDLPQDAMDYVQAYRTDEQIEQAKLDAYQIFYDSNESWGWVKSIFRADTIISTIPTAEQYADLIAFEDILDDNDEVLVSKDVIKEQFIAEYNLIMGDLIDEQGGNGIYLLSVFAALVTLLSQLLTKWSNGGGKKKKDKEINKANPLKNANDKPTNAKQPNASLIMMIVMPAVMLLFTLTNNAAFAIYIITSQLISAATIPLTTLISRKIDEKQERKKAAQVEVSYRRK